VNNVSFSGLRDIFIGRFDANYCVKTVIFLKSSDTAKEYLIGIHKVVFPDGDANRKEKWRSYPHIKGGPNIVPIKEKDLLNTKFVNKKADKLSFDILRFTEFLSGYAKVDYDLKPIMLHYAMIYLFDFFSRTWLKYGRTGGHGMKGLKVCPDDFSVRIEKQGVFQRAVDAFYFLGQSSLFSPDDDVGIGYQLNMRGRTVSEKIEKMKYSKTPRVKLNHLIDIYMRLRKIVGSVSISNPILVGYAILFIMSSISRYRAEEWFKIRENRKQRNILELLQYDFLYEWIPEIFMQTILRKGLKEELSIPRVGLE